MFTDQTVKEEVVRRNLMEFMSASMSQPYIPSYVKFDPKQIGTYVRLNKDLTKGIDHKIK